MIHYCFNEILPQNKHSFHIVDQSPWPLINSLNLINFLSAIVIIIKTNYFLNKYLILLLLVTIITSIILWWRDIIRERTFQGNHTFPVFNILKNRIILFILREIIFFTRFFWAFSHFSLNPEFEIGNSWPPCIIKIINPYHLPLLNTIILLSSGAIVTWAHYSILTYNYKCILIRLSITILIGIVFTLAQIIEYNWTEYAINDRNFGSIFFITTGFHGIHVIIGSSFLTVNLYRILKNQLNNIHHFSFEAAIWYWHFVDVVWIYLYIIIYWWFY